MALKKRKYKFDNVLGTKDTILGFREKIKTNDFEEIRNKEVILQSISSILSTPRRKRIRDPEFGSNLYKFLFEPTDIDTVKAIQQEVYESIEEQEERITVNNVDVKFLSNNKGFVVDVYLTVSGKYAHQQIVITPESFSILKET